MGSKVTCFRSYGLAGLLCLLLSAPAWAGVKCSSSCSKWAVCEIDLTTVSTILTDETLYGIRPSATITRVSPSETTTATGFFYDRDASGHGKLKIRFNPSGMGSYNYTVNSSFAFTYDDPTSFTCANAVPLAGGGTNHGFLRVDPSFPQSFIWDDTNRLFLWGQTYYQITNKARKAQNDQDLGNPFDDSTWQTPITNSAGYRMNKVRLLVTPWSGDSRIPIETYAFPKNTDGTLYLDKIDTQHWKALDRVVDFLYGKGIIADLILFHDNTTTPFGTMTQNQKYTKYTVARYAAYPNVIWSLSNEYQNVTVPPLTNASWNDLGCLIRGGCGVYTTGADPWLTRSTFRRPLSIHPNVASASYPCFEFFTAGWPTHASLQSKHPFSTIDQSAFDAVARNRNPSDPSACSGLSGSTKLPVVDDEYGCIADFSSNAANDVLAHRKAIWAVVTAGGFGSAGSDRGAPFQPTLSTDWQDEPNSYGDIKNLFGVIVDNAIPYWKMSPLTNSGTTSGVHELGVGGVAPDYLIYSSSGTSVAASGLATGNYKKSVFDPHKDPATNPPTVNNCCSLSTGSPTFSVSPAGDWVIWLHGRTCAPTGPCNP
jgi:hypothetical protein